MIFLMLYGWSKSQPDVKYQLLVETLVDVGNERLGLG